MPDDGLTIWTIYRRPSDLPGVQYAARKWVSDASGSRPDPNVLVAGSLAAIRSELPPGLHRLDRDPADDPAIVETWL